MNAASFAAQGFARVLPEEEMTAETLMENILTLYDNRNKYVERMEKSGLSDGTMGVLSQIRKF